MDASFHFVKRALTVKQAEYDLTLQNAIETGILSVDQALAIWEAVCVDMEPTKGKDGVYFLGRKMFKITPHSQSKTSI